MYFKKKLFEKNILNRFILISNHYTSHIGIAITIHFYSNRLVLLNVHAHKAHSPLQFTDLLGSLHSCWNAVLSQLTIDLHTHTHDGKIKIDV